MAILLTFCVFVKTPIVNLSGRQLTHVNKPNSDGRAW